MPEHLEVRVANLDCENDAARIRRDLGEAPGVSRLEVLPKAAKVRFTFDESLTTPEALQERLRALGFPPQPRGTAPSIQKPWRNPKVLTSVGSGVLLLAGWLVDRGGQHGVALVLYLASTVSGGWYFGREALEELVLERQVGIELLMLTAAIAATAMGQAAEGSMLAFLYSISEAAEGYTEEKTRSAIRALMDLTPKVALVRRDGHEQTIPVESIRVGDVFIVKPGESLATDGTVVAGVSSVNQAPVTGESVPVPKTTGSAVFAGSINEEGSLEICATKTFADNTVSRIVHMVEEAQEQKGRSQRFIDRFGVKYSPLVLLAGILLAVVPGALTGHWQQWLERATVLVVAAAPCALVISIPITLVATLGTAARRGVLIKGGIYVEELAKIIVVALDKTGTLTRGEPEVTGVLLSAHAAAGSERAMLAAAAAVERRSQHPLARAILRHVSAAGIEVPEPVNFQSLPGLGASAHVDGREVFVGSPELFSKKFGFTSTSFDGDVSRLQDEGNTVVFVGGPAGIEAAIAVRDTLRPNARRAVQALKDAGVQRVVMLTGDNERTARAIAREAGVDEVFADLKPEDKAIRVRELSDSTGHVAMVGDGVNDAPALAAATIGVAMGAAGTDVALETADVALMADDLERLAYALRLARRNQRVVRQNLWLSVVVIAILVIGAVAGVFNLPVTVLGHELSEFVVIASGLRMLRG